MAVYSVPVRTLRRKSSVPGICSVFSSLLRRRSTKPLTDCIFGNAKRARLETICRFRRYQREEKEGSAEPICRHPTSVGEALENGEWGMENGERCA